MLGIGLVVGFIIGVLFGIWLGKQLPNGEPIVLSLHPRVIEGRCYWIESIIPRRSGVLLKESIAVLQDAELLYNPFLVFVIMGDNCKGNEGQLVQAIYQEDNGVEKIVLFPVIIKKELTS